MTKYVFEFSRRFKHPVILRTTTRVSHSRGVVELGPIPEVRVKGGLIRRIGLSSYPLTLGRTRLSCWRSGKRSPRWLMRFPSTGLRVMGER